MPTPYRSFDAEHFRNDLVQHAFAPLGGSGECFGIWIELFAGRWDESGDHASPASFFGGDPEVRLADLLVDFAHARALDVHAPDSGVESRRLGSRGRLSFQPGGKLRYRTPACATPLEAWTDLRSTVELLEREFAGRSVALFGFGAEPWHAPDELEASDFDPVIAARERLFASSSVFGTAALRQTARMGVIVGIGGAVQSALRWKAAHLLAPVCTAMFAHSPFAGGAYNGFKSFRAHAWRRAEPSRTGVPPTFIDHPSGNRIAQYLAFALEAKVLGMNAGQGWRAFERPTTFSQWIESGVDGLYPAIEDWRAHLDTLDALVRPDGAIELGYFDAQVPSRACVPLVFAAALLSDSEALRTLVGRYELRARDLPRALEQAERDGLADRGLAADARELVGLCADALLRSSASWFDNGMRAEFVGFAERCTLRGRAPADDLLEAFLSRGALDRTTVDEYRSRIDTLSLHAKTP